MQMSAEGQGCCCCLDTDGLGWGELLLPRHRWTGKGGVLLLLRHKWAPRVGADVA